MSAPSASAAAPAISPVQEFLAGPIGSIAMFLPIILIFYFLIIRPQQRRAKEHAAQTAAVKRGDTVVLSNGMIGKVTRVEEQEAMVEISQGVNVRVLKGMIAEVRNPQIAAANDKS